MSITTRSGRWASVSSIPSRPLAARPTSSKSSSAEISSAGVRAKRSSSSTTSTRTGARASDAIAYTLKPVLVRGRLAAAEIAQRLHAGLPASQQLVLWPRLGVCCAFGGHVDVRMRLRLVIVVLVGLVLGLRLPLSRAPE